ncbi:hypothetical protein Tco_0223179 [Tanacetum coccineum]
MHQLIPSLLIPPKGKFEDANDNGLDVDHPLPRAECRCIPILTIVMISSQSWTMEAIETVTRSQERMTRREMERQLASVQESQQQDRENFRKLQELVTSQLGRHP